MPRTLVRSAGAGLLAALPVLGVAGCGGSPAASPTVNPAGATHAPAPAPGGSGDAPVPLPLTIDPVGTLQDAGDTVFTYASSNALNNPGQSFAAGYQAIQTASNAGITPAAATASAVTQILGYTVRTARQWHLQRDDTAWWSLSVPGVNAIACLRATPPSGTDPTVVAAEHEGEAKPGDCAEIVASGKG